MLKRVLVYLLVLVIPLSIYFFTLSPTVNFGDSGELIAASYFLGIPHPPGSPLWVLLTHPFTYLPFKTIAWRVNFSSTVFAVLSALILAFLIRRILKSQNNSWSVFFSGLIASLTLTFNNSFWGQAVIAEIHTLNVLFFLLIFWSLYEFLTTLKDRFLYLTVLLFGLNLGNHYLILIVAPAIFLTLLIFERKQFFTIRRISLGLVSLVLGLSIYLYLPVRALQNPVINWGNPNNWDRFWAHVTRQQFRQKFYQTEGAVAGISLPINAPRSSNEAFARIGSSLVTFLKILLLEFPVPVLVLSLIGIIALWFLETNHPHIRKFWWLVVLSFLTSGPGFAYLNNSQITPLSYRFAEYLYPFAIVSFLSGIGLWQVLKFSQKFMRFFAIIPIFLSLTIPGFLIWKNYPVNNWSQNFVAFHHVHNIFRLLPQNALLIADKNNWVFPLFYMQQVEKIRPDVNIFDRTGNLFEKVYSPNLTQASSPETLEQYRQNVEQDLRKKYPDRPLLYAVDKDFENFERRVNQKGILYEDPIGSTYTTVNMNQEYNNILSVTNSVWGDGDTEYMLAYYHLRLADWYFSQKNDVEGYKELETALRLASKHTVLLTNVANYYADKKEHSRAIELYRKISELNPDSDLNYFNLALSLEETNQLDEAIKMYEKTLSINPYQVKALARLSKYYEEKQDYEKSLQFLMSLEKVSPDKPAVARQEIAVLSKMGKCDMAETMLWRLQQQIGLSAGLLNDVGVCWAKKKEYQKAKENWEASLKLDPDYSESKANLEQLEKILK